MIDITATIETVAASAAALICTGSLIASVKIAFEAPVEEPLECSRLEALAEKEEVK
jgi:hypothetical protein